MSPKRQDSQRASASISNSKPYSKAAASIADGPDHPQTEIARAELARSNPGFPTFAQYKRVENAYIKSLNPRRQAKALISQAMFDRVWDVLHQPDSPQETAQFRFWARKMFTLSNVSHPAAESGTPNSPPQVVVLHDNLLVAIQEQLYDLLCYCHGITNHGGRDKTCAAIRKHYTWVPKELVSQFTKACPTCIMKKCGHPDLSALSGQAQASAGNPDDASLPDLRDFLRNLVAHNGVNPRDENGCHITRERESSHSSASSTTPDNPVDQLSNDSVSKMHSSAADVLSSPRPLQSLPMSREVSLYQGLPNGWQFHSDYATAHAAFMKTKDKSMPSDAARGKRPRIPSIAPMIGVHLPGQDTISNETRLRADVLPSMVRNFLGEDRGVTTAGPLASRPFQSLQVLSEDRTPNSTAQIDPALFALYTCLPSDLTSITPLPFSAQTTEVSLPKTDKGTDRREVPAASPAPISRKISSSSSIRRAAAPPLINLESLGSLGNIQAFISLRDRAEPNPDSPLSTCSLASPTGSVESYTSQLSAFPMTATSSISPANTALPTPVDEEVHLNGEKFGKALAMTADRMDLGAAIGTTWGGA